MVSFRKLGNGKLENERDEKVVPLPDTQSAQQFTMSARKYIPLAIVIGFGVWNGKSDPIQRTSARIDGSAGYYSFAPSLKEENQRRQGANLR